VLRVKEVGDRLLVRVGELAGGELLLGAEVTLVRAVGQDRDLRADHGDEVLGGGVLRAVVRDLVDVGLDQLGVILIPGGEPGDAQLLEIAGEQHRGGAEVDPDHDAVVVALVTGLRCAERAAPQGADVRIDRRGSAGPDRVDDLAAQTGGRDVVDHHVAVTDVLALAPGVHPLHRLAADIVGDHAVVDEVADLVALEHRLHRPGVVDVRVRQEQGVEGALEIGPGFEEAVEVGKERRLAVVLLVLLAAGVDEDDPTRELDQVRGALADVDEVDAHGRGGVGVRRTHRRSGPRRGQVLGLGEAARGLPGPGRGSPAPPERDDDDQAPAHYPSTIRYARERDTVSSPPVRAGVRDVGLLGKPGLGPGPAGRLLRDLPGHLRARDPRSGRPDLRRGMRRRVRRAPGPGQRRR
jgi:hypothetical protein